MKKSEIKDHNKEAKKKLDQISATINNPFESDDIDGDYEKLFQTLRKENIDAWFNITQSNMKILFDLKKKGLLRDEKTHSRKINENLEAIGWSNIKEEADIREDNLDPTSPIVMLKQMYEIDSMILKRTEASIKRAIKDFDKYFEKRSSGETAVSYPDLDDASDIYNLYESSIKDQTQRELALKDINEIGALKLEYEELKSALWSVGGAFRKNSYLNPFVEEFIDRAIALGYTAGINANTTQTLRKMKNGNKSNSDSGEK